MSNSYQYISVRSVSPSRICVRLCAGPGGCGVEVRAQQTMDRVFRGRLYGTAAIQHHPIAEVDLLRNTMVRGAILQGLREEIQSIETTFSASTLRAHNK